MRSTKRISATSIVTRIVFNLHSLDKTSYPSKPLFAELKSIRYSLSATESLKIKTQWCDFNVGSYANHWPLCDIILSISFGR